MFNVQCSIVIWGEEGYPIGERYDRPLVWTFGDEPCLPDTQGSGLVPSFRRRGGRAIKKNPEGTFERRGRGGCFKHPTIELEQPPRLRPLRMLRGIFLMAQPPLIVLK